MTEQALQKKITDYLESLDQCWTVKTISTNKAGTPDILCCYLGTFYAFEVKSPNGKGVVSKLQKFRIRQIKEAGGEAFVVSSLDEVKEIL